MGKSFGKSWGRTTTIFMRIPVVSFFVSWWVVSPSTEGLEKIMNTLGIVDALMLTLAVGMVGMVNYEELRNNDDRFMRAVDGTVTFNATTWVDFYITGGWTGSEKNVVPDFGDFPNSYNAGPIKAPSQSFIQSVLLSTFFFTISLLAIVMLLALMGMADLDKEGSETEGETERVQRARIELEQWFKYNNITLFMAVLWFLVAVVLFFRAMWFLVLIKIPDYQVLQWGTEVGTPLYSWPALLGYIIGAIMCMVGTIGCWSNYAVYAYGKYGQPQSVWHVIFYRPAVPAPGRNDLEGATSSSAPSVVPLKYDSSKVVPLPPAHQEAAPGNLISAWPQGASASSQDVSALTGVIASLAAEIRTLNLRIDTLSSRMDGVQPVA